MAIPLELLLKDQAPLVSVNMSDPLTIAISLMREHEFSQLPVVEGTKPLGLVTGDSIARALFNLGTPLDSLHVSDAVLKSLTFTAEDELLDVVDSLMLTAAVLIVDPQGDLKGIITNYDTIQFFRSRAEDIMRLEDIETTLRQHIRAAYNATGEQETPDLEKDVSKLNMGAINRRDACGKALKQLAQEMEVKPTTPQIKAITDTYFPFEANTKGFSSLTLAQYIELALTDKCWSKLRSSYNIPIEGLKSMLNSVRETRNKFVHFRSDITPIERDQLRFCADWFRNHPLSIETENVEVQTEVDESIIEDIHKELKDPVVTEEKKNLPKTKYAPLGAYLASLRPAVTGNGLSFEMIEKILGFNLPRSAREHPSWWANDSVAHNHSKLWLDSGWRVADVDFGRGKVIFVRKDSPAKIVEILKNGREDVDSETSEL